MGKTITIDSIENIEVAAKEFIDYISNSSLESNIFAFYGCLSLSNIVLSENLIWLYGGAFGNCPFIESIYCKSTTPPTFVEVQVDYSGGAMEIWDKPFDDNIFIIYVPMESVDAYKSAEGWSQYADYIVGYEF